MRGKVNDSVCVKFDQHELIDEVVAEVREVSYRWRYLGEIADRYRSVSSQAVRFDDAVKLDVADAAVGE